MCGGSQCSSGEAGAFCGGAALGHGVPLVGGVVLRVDDAQGESRGTAVGGVGNVRGGGSVNHGGGGHCSFSAAALGQGVVCGSVEVVFSNH